MRELMIANDVSAIERQVVVDRNAARDRTPESELRLATSLCDLAKALIATRTNEAPRDRTPEAIAPAQEAAGIRLHWFDNGYVSARHAGDVQEALRLFEQATRQTGHRELAASTIRNACHIYRQVAENYPQVAGTCADCLGKCGVWLGRLDQDAAVAATVDAARIRADLAAGNPDLAGKYLASLSTMLRTLMVGRSRKQAIAMYRERYSSFTPMSLQIRLRALSVRDLDLTPKSLTALTELDCRTLEQAGKLTQQEILRKTSGDLSTVEEINWRLALVGARPLTPGEDPEPPAMPVEIGPTFGALGVRCADRDPIARIKAAIVAAYAEDDVQPVDRATYRTATRAAPIADAEMNTARSLGEDVVVIEMSDGGWVTVMTLNWEITPVGRHPLALRLSREWPVVSVSAVGDSSYELCRYDSGRATQYAAMGRPSGISSLDHALAPIDFEWLATYGAHSATANKLRVALGNTRSFANLTFLPSSGIRQIGRSVPLIDHDHVLFFRKSSGGSGDAG